MSPEKGENHEKWIVKIADIFLRLIREEKIEIL